MKLQNTNLLYLKIDLYFLYLLKQFEWKFIFIPYFVLHNIQFISNQKITIPNGMSFKIEFFQDNDENNSNSK